MKRYRLQAPDGKWESVNEEMFDYNILVVLNRLTRTGDWVSAYQLARSMYARPNARTFQNVRDSLERARAARQVRAAIDNEVGESRGPRVYQIVRKAR